MNELENNTVEVELNSGADLEAPKLLDFPYSFAKRNGVVLQRTVVSDAVNGTESGLIVHYKKGLTPTVANEVNRFLEANATFKLMENDEFERTLARQYDNSGDGASAMMDDIGEELDLNDVADLLPEPEDLLESEDSEESLKTLS